VTKQAINAYNSLMAEGPSASSAASSLPYSSIAEQASKTISGSCDRCHQQRRHLEGPTIFRDCFIDPYQARWPHSLPKSRLEKGRRHLRKGR
jgi:branched-chain amino acid transport system substrate-binding protein